MARFRKSIILQRLAPQRSRAKVIAVDHSFTAFDAVPHLTHSVSKKQVFQQRNVNLKPGMTLTHACTAVLRCFMTKFLHRRVKLHPSQLFRSSRSVCSAIFEPSLYNGILHADWYPGKGSWWKNEKEQTHRRISNYAWFLECKGVESNYSSSSGTHLDETIRPELGTYVPRCPTHHLEVPVRTKITKRAPSKRCRHQEFLCAMRTYCCKLPILNSIWNKPQGISSLLPQAIPTLDESAVSRATGTKKTWLTNALDSHQCPGFPWLPIESSMIRWSCILAHASGNCATLAKKSSVSANR